MLTTEEFLLELQNIDCRPETMFVQQPQSEENYAVGYSSLASFSNTFNKLVGQRPSEFATRQQQALPSGLPGRE